MMEQSEEQRIICLLSSNSTERYLVDILTILAMPPGSVYHFRYELKWLDKELRDVLTKDPEQLKGTPVVIAYLYKAGSQEGSPSERWERIYPVRLGVLKEAFSTGLEDEDVALFYFEVDKFIEPEQKTSNDPACHCNDFTKKIVGIIEEKSRPNDDNTLDLYAVLVNAWKDIGLEGKQIGPSGFFRVCESIEAGHIALVSGQKYENVYFYLHGITDENGKTINQKYNENLRKSYYELTEGESYSLTLFVYSPHKVLDSKVEIKYDEKFFSSPSTYALNVLSRYDEESFLMVPSLVDKEMWSTVNIKTASLKGPEAEKDGDAQFLPVDVSLNVKILRNESYRRLGLKRDISLGLATMSFAARPFFDSKCDNLISLFGFGCLFFWIYYSIKFQSWRG